MSAYLNDFPFNFMYKCDCGYVYRDTKFLRLRKDWNCFRLRCSHCNRTINLYLLIYSSSSSKSNIVGVLALYIFHTLTNIKRDTDLSYTNFRRYVPQIQQILDVILEDEDNLISEMFQLNQSLTVDVYCQLYLDEEYGGNTPCKPSWCTSETDIDTMVRALSDTLCLDKIQTDIIIQRTDKLDYLADEVDVDIEIEEDDRDDEKYVY